MQRGSHTFNSLFSDQDTTVIQLDARKGRNVDLDAARNEKLVYRYFYYGFYTDKRLEKIYTDMVLEFDISARRIADIISERLPELQQLRKNPPSLRELRAKYPFLTWEA